MGAIKASADTIRLIIAVAIGAAILFLGQMVMDWKAGAEQNQARGRTLETTSGILRDGAAAQKDREETDATVATGREEFNKQYEEAKTNEPKVADRASRSVPQRVLDAHHERRLSRERSGCAGDDCKR